MVDDSAVQTPVVWSPETPLSDGMADAAQINSGLPLELVVMAMDDAFGSLDPDHSDYRGSAVTAIRFRFEEALNAAVMRYVDGELTGY